MASSLLALAGGVRDLHQSGAKLPMAGAGCCGAVHGGRRLHGSRRRSVNNEALYAHAMAVTERKIKEANVRLCPQFMAAEDFGFYS
jgi:metal-dependent amidase/aminoacylase/carboxypeptidase family protein